MKGLERRLLGGLDLSCAVLEKESEKARFFGVFFGEMEPKTAAKARCSKV